MYNYPTKEEIARAKEEKRADYHNNIQSEIYNNRIYLIQSVFKDAEEIQNALGQMWYIHHFKNGMHMYLKNTVCEVKFFRKKAKGQPWFMPIPLYSTNECPHPINLITEWYNFFVDGYKHRKNWDSNTDRQEFGSFDADKLESDEMVEQSNRYRDYISK